MLDENQTDSISEIYSSHSDERPTDYEQARMTKLREVQEIDPCVPHDIEFRLEETDAVLERLKKDRGKLHPWETEEIELAKFTVTLGSESSVLEGNEYSERNKIIFALNGLPHGRKQLMFQEIQLAEKYGTCVSCEFPENWMYLDLHVAQTIDAIHTLRSEGKEIVLMGTSMGGILAELVAKKYKEKYDEEIDSLVLNNPVGAEDFPKPLRKFAESWISRDSEFGGETVSAVVDWLARIYPYEAPPGVGLEYKDIYEEGIKVNKEMLLSRVAALLEAYKKFDELGGHQLPENTAVIYNKEDSFLGRRTRKNLANNKSIKHVEEVPGGHSRMYDDIERPGEYLEAMEQCIDYLLARVYANVEE